MVSFYWIIISKNEKVLIIGTYQTTSTVIQIYLLYANIGQYGGLCFKYLFTQTNAKYSIVLIVFFVSMQSPTASTYAVQEIPSIPPAQMPGDWVWARACKANSVTG